MGGHFRTIPEVMRDVKVGENARFLKDFGGISLVLRVRDSVNQCGDREGRWNQWSDVMRTYSEAPNA